jgi:hypothetical protein
VIISLNSTDQLIFVIEKCFVFFEVGTEFLNIIQMSFSFKGLIFKMHKHESLLYIYLFIFI